MSHKVALLEQSGVAPDALSEARREACDLLGWRHLRLNWNPQAWHHEPEGTLRHAAITWSEGRSELFNAAFDLDTKYFIFIDDDILFSLPGQSSVQLTGSSTLATSQLEALSRLAHLLDHYPLMTGTIFSPTDWGHRNLHAGELERLREVFPVACHDLQVQIFERRVAEKTFPLPIPGSGASAWHVQFLGNTLWPQNQLCLASVWAHNTACRPHADSSIPSFHDKEALLEKITLAIRSSLWNDWCDNDFQGVHGPMMNAKLRTTAPAQDMPTNWESAWHEIFDCSQLDPVPRDQLVVRRSKLHHPVPHRVLSMLRNWPPRLMPWRQPEN